MPNSKKKPTKKAVSKKSTASARTRLNPDARIVVLKKTDLPFREGSGRLKRAQAVLQSKTVADALKKKAHTHSISWLREHKFIRVS